MAEGVQGVGRQRTGERAGSIAYPLAGNVERLAGVEQWEQAVSRPDHLGRVGLGEVDLLGIEVVAGICRNWNERGAGRFRGNWVAVAVDGDVDRLEEVRLGGEPGA